MLFGKLKSFAGDQFNIRVKACFRGRTAAAMFNAKL